MERRTPGAWRRNCNERPARSRSDSKIPERAAREFQRGRSSSRARQPERNPLSHLVRRRTAFDPGDITMSSRAGFGGAIKNVLAWAGLALMLASFVWWQIL